MIEPEPASEPRDCSAGDISSAATAAVAARMSKEQWRLSKDHPSRLALADSSGHPTGAIRSLSSASACKAFEYPGYERHVRPAPYVSLLERCQAATHQAG